MSASTTDYKKSGAGPAEILSAIALTVSYDDQKDIDLLIQTDLQCLKTQKAFSAPKLSFLFPTAKLKLRLKLIELRDSNDPLLSRKASENDLLSIFYLAVNYSRTKKEIGKALTFYAKFLLQCSLEDTKPEELLPYQVFAHDFIQDMIEHDAKKDYFNLTEDRRVKYKAYATQIRDTLLNIPNHRSLKKYIKLPEVYVLFGDSVVSQGFPITLTIDMLLIALLNDDQNTCLDKLLNSKDYPFNHSVERPAKILSAYFNKNQSQINGYSREFGMKINPNDPVECYIISPATFGPPIRLSTLPQDQKTFSEKKPTTMDSNRFVLFAHKTQFEKLNGGLLIREPNAWAEATSAKDLHKIL